MAFGKFAQYSPDEITYNPHRFDLVKELRSCFDYVASEDGGTHDMHFESAVGTLPVLSDPQHLKYIIINLLQNATKYSEAGTPVTISLSRVNGKPHFTVTDRGIGIPQDAIDQLYSPFFRANNVAERPGTGLGLAILKRSAKILDAKVEVNTVLGEGTTFAVTLPAEHLRPS